VLLWNNDITPGPGYFKKALEAIDSGSPIICSVVYFKNPADRILSSGGYFNRRSGKKSLYNYKMKDTEATYNDLKIDWFGGMGTLIRKDLFDHIGYFDEVRFPQYHGDSDFGIRATMAGYKIHLAPELKIWNDVANSGLHSRKNLRGFIQSFYSIKSNYNIKKDILFYRIYSESYRAYGELVRKYFIYVAAFVKWKLLGVFGIKKTN
jgi:GT2 family glycosyltransferase